MKMNTPCFARFESRGYPKLTKQVNGETRDVMRAYLEWLLTAPMGSRIVLTMSRTEFNLGNSTDRLPDTDLFAEILDAAGVDLSEEA